MELSSRNLSTKIHVAANYQWQTFLGRASNNQITVGVWLLSRDTFSFLDNFCERTRTGMFFSNVLVAAISVHGGLSSNNGTRESP